MKLIARSSRWKRFQSVGQNSCMTMLARTDTMKASSGAGLTFLFLVSILCIVTRGYTLGAGEQVAEVPGILNAADASYLEHDYFVNLSARADHPNRVYFWFMGLLVRVLGIPASFLLMTFVAKVLLAAATFHAASSLAARHLPDRQRAVAGGLATILVLGVDGMRLGGANVFSITFVTAESLAVPIALWSLLLAWKQQYSGAASTGLVSLLLEPITAFYIVATGFAASVVATAGDKSDKSDEKSHSGAAIPGSLLLLAAIGFGIFLAWQIDRAAIADTDFVEIFGARRFGDLHFLQFISATSYVAFSGFLVGTIVAVWGFSRDDTFAPSLQRRLKAALLITLAVASLALITNSTGNASRWLIKAEPVKAIFLFKWAGLVAIGTILAHHLFDRRTGPVVWGIYFSTGPLQPVAAAAGLILVRWRRLVLSGRLPGGVSMFVFAGFAIAGTAMVVGLMMGVPRPVASEVTMLVSGAALLWACFLAPRKLRMPAVAWVTVAVLSTVVFLPATRTWVPTYMRPAIGLQTLPNSASGAAGYARNSTPDDAIFAIPPHKGAFRFLAGRAVVVDHRCIPTVDSGIQAWNERMTAAYEVYGDTGFKDWQRMTSAYGYTAPETFINLARSYGATHALVYTTMETSMPILYRDRVYTIIKIVDGG